MLGTSPARHPTPLTGPSPSLSRICSTMICRRGASALPSSPTKNLLLTRRRAHAIYSSRATPKTVPGVIV